MSYQVRCECGKSKAVSAADAGSSVTCGCGRSIEVPPLHQLRASVGEETLSPAVRIQALLLEGKLPGTRDCACCHRDTDRQVRVGVKCEWAQVKSSGPSRGEIIGGGLFGAWVAGLLLIRRHNAPSVERGQDVAFALPLPVCEACDATLDEPGRLKGALCQVPEYVTLLERYPDARVTRQR